MSVIPITSTRINSRSSTTSRDPDPPFDLRQFQAIALQHPYSTAFLFGSSLTLVACSGAWLTKRLLFPSRAIGRGQVTRSELLQVQKTVIERLDSLENRLGMQLRMVQPDKNLRKSVMGRMQGIEDQLEELSHQQTGVSHAAAGVQSPYASSKVRSEMNRMNEDELKIMEEIHFAGPKATDSAESLNDELAYLFGAAEHDKQTGGPVSDTQGWRTGTIDVQGNAKDDIATAVKAGAQTAASSSTGSSVSPAASSSSASSTVTSGNPDKGYAVYKRPAAIPFGGLRMGLGKHGPMPIVDPSNPNYM